MSRKKNNRQSKIIALQILSYVNEKGLTQSDTAKLVGKSRQYVSKVINKHKQNLKPKLNPKYVSVEEFVDKFRTLGWRASAVWNSLNWYGIKVDERSVRNWFRGKKAKKEFMPAIRYVCDSAWHPLKEAPQSVDDWDGNGYRRKSKTSNLKDLIAEYGSDAEVLGWINQNAQVLDEELEPVLGLSTDYPNFVRLGSDVCDISENGRVVFSSRYKVEDDE